MSSLMLIVFCIGVIGGVFLDMAIISFWNIKYKSRKKFGKKFNHGDFRKGE